jgi:CheY-like chemotaxis protein
VAAETLADALGLLLATAPAARAFVTEPGLRDRRRRERHILAVDDNPLNNRLVRVLLENAGHRVSLVADGEAAVDAVAAGDVDAVLMDVQMPGIDGLEATRRIRALPAAAAATPIIAVTANAGAPEADACRAAGMTGFLTKPIDRAALMDALERALAPSDDDAG